MNKRSTAMPWLVPALLFATFAWGQGLPAPAVKRLPVETPQRILFLGNSLVYYNNGLQTHTHRLVSSADPALAKISAGYKSVHITGAPLEQYPIDQLLAPGQLGNKQPFEIVVLAGNSVDAMSDAGRAKFRDMVIDFDAKIKKQGGRTAIYWHPTHIKPSRFGDSDMGRRNADMYLAVSNEVGALLLPVGPAFDEAYRQRPGMRLQMEYDGNHPNLAGTYLAASVVYASLYGRSPVGNPYDYFGRLDKETTSFLQTVANETVRKFFNR